MEKKKKKQDESRFLEAPFVRMLANAIDELKNRTPIGLDPNTLANWLIFLKFLFYSLLLRFQLSICTSVLLFSWRNLARMIADWIWPRPSSLLQLCAP